MQLQEASKETTESREEVIGHISSIQLLARVDKAKLRGSKLRLVQNTTQQLAFAKHHFRFSHNDVSRQLTTPLATSPFLRVNLGLGDEIEWLLAFRNEVQQYSRHHLFPRPENSRSQNTWWQQAESLRLPRQGSLYQLVVVMAMKESSSEGHEYGGNHMVLDKTTERSSILGHQVLHVGRDWGHAGFGITAHSSHHSPML
jgi:hypothetical protein